jgi:hypothetical protein
MRIRQVVGIGAGVGLALAVAAGCAAKKPAPFPDVMTFCTAKAQAECQIASTCAIDTSDCQAHRATVCNSEAIAATSSGTRAYVQANAQACIDALNSAYGGGNSKVGFAQLVGEGSITDLCERVFSGTAGMGESCQSSYDCTNGNICAPGMPGIAALADGGAPAGAFVCEPEVAVPEGQLCSNPGSTCATDTYCAIPAGKVTYECTAAMPQNSPCDPVTAPCVSTQRCEPQGGTAGSACEPRVKLGEPCQTNDDCVPDAPYCDPYIGKCTQGQSFASLAPDCDEFTTTGAAVTGSATDAGAD